MNDHFTVTIHDDNGVKQFNLHQFVKTVVLYVGVFMAFIGFSAVGTIYYLDYEVDRIEQKGLEMQISNTALKEKNKLLNKSMKETENILSIKKDELEDLSESLSKIEMMIGLNPPEDTPLKERINLTKVNSQEMMVLLQFVPSGTPIEFKGITSKFGYRMHPILKRREFHHGIDMRAKMKTPVYATADGIVEWAGMKKKSGYGRLIVIQHNYGFKTYFGHLKKVVVKSGQFIKKGDLIAYSGNSGRSNGPHLHYEIRFNERVVDPTLFLKWNLNNYQEIFKKEKKIPWQSLIAMTKDIKIQAPTKTRQSSQLVQKSKVK